MFQLAKGTRYAIVVDVPSAVTDGAIVKTMVDVVGFTEARVIVEPAEEVNPAGLIAAAQAVPGFVQSSNRKMRVVLATWHKNDHQTNVFDEPFRGAEPEDFYIVRGAQGIKTGLKNWSWIKPLALVGGAVGIGAWLLTKLDPDNRAA